MEFTKFTIGLIITNGIINTIGKKQNTIICIIDAVKCINFVVFIVTTPVFTDVYVNSVNHNNLNNTKKETRR